MQCLFQYVAIVVFDILFDHILIHYYTSLQCSVFFFSVFSIKLFISQLNFDLIYVLLNIQQLDYSVSYTFSLYAMLTNKIVKEASINDYFFYVF